MTFPFLKLRFSLVDYVEKDDMITYVRYLMKAKEKMIYISVEKKEKGYVQRIQMLSIQKEELREKYYPTDEQAFHALFSSMAQVNANE